MIPMKCYSYARFSSPAQAKGFSLERQLEKVERYLEENNKLAEGWVLDRDLCMEDAGLSAYRDEHKTKGELGVFLKAVKAGKIPVPSALLIENFDRLSRASVSDALYQFMNLINSGITIVTLLDGCEYSKESIDNENQQLLMSIMTMNRAHEESKVKADRTKATWEKRRKEVFESNGAKKIITKPPGWLRYSKSKNNYELIPERAEVVKRIFQMYNSGCGVSLILKTLNHERVPSFATRSKGNRYTWGITSVRNILRNRAVIGEKQYRTTVGFNKNGVRLMEPIGEPIQGYYPQIISDELFAETQAKIKQREMPYGRVGNVNNIFQGLVHCGYCDSTMHFSHRGRSKLPYLACRAARQKDLKCTDDLISFRYDCLETAFLKGCRRLDLTEIVEDDINEIDLKISNLKHQKSGLKKRYTKTIKGQKNIENSILEAQSERDRRHFSELLSIELDKKDKFQNEMAELDREINRLRCLHNDTEQKLNDAKDAIALLANAEGMERKQLRLKLQRQIRALVEKIVIYPAGNDYQAYEKALKNIYNPQLAKALDTNDKGALFYWLWATSIGDDQDKKLEAIKQMAGVNPITNRRTRTNNFIKHFRQCVVYFKAGGTLQFVDNGDDDNPGLVPYMERDEHGRFTNESVKRMAEYMQYSPEELKAKLAGMGLAANEAKK